MPFAGFENFEACVKHQLEMGHDEESARRICGFLEKQTQAFVYHASFQPFIAGGKRFAKIYVIDDTVNKNAWGVTPEARAKALPSLLRAPLLGPPIPGILPASVHVADGLPHAGEWAVYGTFLDFISNGATYGVAEIPVDAAWERIHSSELNAASPSVFVKSGHSDKGAVIADSFEFDHVLFVDNPAYRNVGVVGTCEGPSPEFCNFSQALQAALVNQGHGVKPGQDVGSYSPNQAGKDAREKTGESLKGEGFMKTKIKQGDSIMDKEETKEQGCTKCTELEAKVKALEEQAQAPSEREAVLQAEVKKLSEWQASFLGERLEERAKRVLDLELQAGLVEEAKATEELDRLKKLGIPALEALAVRFEAMIRTLEALPTGPKAKYDREQARSIEEDIRQAMFGIRRDWKNIDPVTGLGKPVGAE